MAKEPVYGKRDTMVRFWVDGEYFYSTVPWRAAKGAERAHEFYHDTEDYRALCYLANVARNHRNNPRGKGVEITADELGVEIVPHIGEKKTPEYESHELPTKKPPRWQQESLF